MICTSDDLSGWKDFPRGLRVLLLDQDSENASEIKSKLEDMDYIVTTFCNVDDALMAISINPGNFHVALVEVSTSNQEECFKFLETRSGLPTIMTSTIQCISTMMKCIALGAAEFLQKPLSEDKLRNIWQHVVHKVFNAKDTTISKSLRPIKEIAESLFRIKQEANEAATLKIMVKESSAFIPEGDNEQSSASDKFPAPSTPQLKQGSRFSNDQDFQGKANVIGEKAPEELEGESKFVDTTCNSSVADTTSDSSPAEVTVTVDPSPIPNETVTKGDLDSKTGSNIPPRLLKGAKADSSNEAGHTRKSSLHPSSGGKKSNRKMKVDWTPDLHKRFVKAVDQLGVDQAIPSRILELMKVDGLTRHNVASHLQKYRMNRRHILPKDDDRRWQHPRESAQRVYPQKPIMAYPTYHPNHSFPTNQFYPVWGHPSTDHSSMQMWNHPSYPTWHPQDNWSWNTNPGVHADAWGRPLIPPSQVPNPGISQYASGYQYVNTVEDSYKITRDSYDFHPAEEVIDKVVREVISQPWLPLPLGLKPPSTDSVLSELHRQGICNIPPPPRDRT